MTGQCVRMKDGKRWQAEYAQRLREAGLRACGVNVFDPERVQDVGGVGVGEGELEVVEFGQVGEEVTIGLEGV